MDNRSAPAPIDPRGPCTNQAVLAVGLLIGLVLGVEWVAPLFVGVLFLGAAFGPSYGPVLRVFRDHIRPRLSPPAEMEDPRPPRFSAAVGVLVLSLATISFVSGAEVLGWALVVVVAALAGLSAVTGLCVGCEIYVLLVRLRGGVRVVTIDSALAPVDEGSPSAGPEHVSESVRSSPMERASRSPRLHPLPAELAVHQTRWVVFSTEYCAVCPSVVAQIEHERPGERVVVLDVADHLELAARYKVRRAPTVLRAETDGSVVARLSGAEAVRRELASTAAA